VAGFLVCMTKRRTPFQMDTGPVAKAGEFGVAQMESLRMYLNDECLANVDPELFQSCRPYPWLSLCSFLTDEGFHRLVETLPEITLFERQYGQQRAYGQVSHDRYALQYRSDLAVAQPWKDFVSELQSEAYWSFLRKLFALPHERRLPLTFHWHYATQGCSVSPHCDASRKLGSHIFYFNTESDWDPQWGGQTLILDDGGRFQPHSAPGFEDLRTVAVSGIIGNQSLIYHRTRHSWHGVRQLSCPPGKFRKVFIVVINRLTPQVWLRLLRAKDADGYPLGSARRTA
jgi:hypothetical protein